MSKRKKIEAAQKARDTNTTAARKAAFVQELTTLSNKHQVAVLGCGCCGSPLLSTDCRFPSTYSYVEGSDDPNLNWGGR